MVDIDSAPLAGTTVAVIGAGMAGLTAARKLVRAGAEVTVFERHAEAGGRLGYVSGAAADLGAQYFTAREPAFKAWTARAKAQGAVAAWDPRGKDSDDEWLVGTPHMASLLTALAEGFTLHTRAEVVAVERQPSGFALALAGEAGDGRFDRVVVAAPAGRAGKLLHRHGGAFQRIDEAVLRPCWVASAIFPTDVGGDVDILRDVGPYRWMARLASRPGRSGTGWIAQATLDWSDARRDADPETIVAELAPALAEALAAPAAQSFAVRLWREAFTTTAVGEPFLMSGDGRIGCCGDWLIAPRLEAAWLSADSLADAMIATASAG